MEHIVHFQGTAYELHVFKIQGHKPGKTLMLIGGIQGNEPGGFLSADLYADMALERGNLIVVPRANFYSIMLNQRGPNGDMNRKFDKPVRRDQEARVVAVLKSLMAESDLMLNLHDGGGFYRPTYVSAKMNPRRFGQSIIADADVHANPKTGQTLRLGDMARKVCQEINKQIDNRLYHFHFNNHRTLEPDSPNLEQRGSATFYALTKVGIPAFGVETSKDLPTIELKVRHHNLAINAFMRMMGIVPENPAINLKKPQLKYLVVSVNNRQPLVVANRETLTVNRGDKIFLSHIEANYERGLSVDILGLGGPSDARQNFAIHRPTSVIVRKDHFQCGWIRLAVKDGVQERLTESNPVAQYFVIQVNGAQKLVANGQALKLVKGDQLKLLEAWTSRGQRGIFALNFKGFVPDKGPNTGDDRGLIIPTDQDLMNKWSLDGRGRRFKVVAERENKDFGEFYVHLAEPCMEYLIVQTGGQSNKYAVSPEETLLMDRDEVLRVVDVKANFDTRQGVKFVLRARGQELPLSLGQGVRLKDLAKKGASRPGRTELLVLRHQTQIGRIFLMPRPLAAGEGKPAGTG